MDDNYMIYLFGSAQLVLTEKDERGKKDLFSLPWILAEEGSDHQGYNKFQSFS